MPEYVIFTDATVDLTDAFVESEKIGILPMEYTMDGATYYLLPRLERGTV